MCVCVCVCVCVDGFQCHTASYNYILEGGGWERGRVLSNLIWVVKKSLFTLLFLNRDM